MDDEKPTPVHTPSLQNLVGVEPLLQLFSYEHLREPLRGISSTFGEAAVKIVMTLPKNVERDNCLRKLREAKDSAVTSFLWKE